MAQTTHTDGAANTLTSRSTVRNHALAVLSDQSHADSETVKATVLRELYRQHPAIALEDILELTVSVAPPETDSVSESVDAVLSEVIEQYGAWKTTELCLSSARASTPATEERR